MLPFFFAFFLSTSKSQRLFPVKSNKKIIREEAEVKDVSYYQFSDITDGSTIGINVISMRNPRIFAFFYIPDHSISSLTIDASRVSFASRDSSYEMFSIDASFYVEFQFASKSGGSSKGSAEFWILNRETCNEYSVGEFGGLEKQLNVNLSELLVPYGCNFCIFSPRLNDVSGMDSLNFGSTSTSSISDKIRTYMYGPNEKSYTHVESNYDPSIFYSTSQASFNQHSFCGSSIRDGTAILNRKVLSTSDKSFYTNNCVALHCQYCTRQICILLPSSSSISFRCNGTSPTPSSPSQTPTSHPSQSPTSRPSQTPTSHPSQSPTSRPSQTPTSRPSQSPTSRPSQTPPSSPSQTPPSSPSQTPTSSLSQSPPSSPSQTPTSHPSQSPTSYPSQSPTSLPSQSPTSPLSNSPTFTPFNSPIYTSFHTFSPTNIDSSKSSSKTGIIVGVTIPVFVVVVIVIGTVCYFRNKKKYHRFSDSSSQINSSIMSDGTDFAQSHFTSSLGSVSSLPAPPTDNQESPHSPSRLMNPHSSPPLTDTEFSLG